MEYRKLGKFQLGRTLASGGMGEIIRSEDHYGRTYALKKILKEHQDNPHFRELFKREAEITFALDHPNIVKAHGFDRVGHQLVLALEYLDGVNLRQVLKHVYDAGKQIPVPIAIEICRLVLRGLHYAHSKRDRFGRSLGIVHRDLNPSNIFVTFSGEVKVLDFGISKATEKSVHDLTPKGEMRGKVAYLAPEQIQSPNVDHRVDIFAMGIVLWEMVTAQPLFPRDSTEETFSAILKGEIRPLKDFRESVPDELEWILLKALMVDRRLRFQTAADFERELSCFARKHYPSSCLQKDLSTFIRVLFKKMPEISEPSFVAGQAWLSVLTHGQERHGLQAILQLAEQYPSDPYIQLTLTRAYLQLGKKLEALRQLRKLSRSEGVENEVQELLEWLGIRRRPILPFLRRSNPLNHALGRVRHRLMGPTNSQQEFMAA